MKIVVEYDPITGIITNPSDGLFIGSIVGMNVTEHVAPEEATAVKNVRTVDELKALRDSGYSISDMAELQRQGLL